MVDPVGGQKNHLFVNFYMYHRKCKRRGVGGQKRTNLVNVVCERPLKLYQIRRYVGTLFLFMNSFPTIFFSIYVKKIM